MPDIAAHASSVLSTIAKFFRVMGKLGIGLEYFQLPIDNKTARTNLAEYLKAGCPKLESVAPATAEVIASDPIAFWQLFWDEHYPLPEGKKHDFSAKIGIAPANLEHPIVLIIPAGLSNNQAYEICERLFGKEKCYRYTENLDRITNDRLTTTTYAVWIDGSSEAPKRFANRSFNDLKKDVGTHHITLLERLVFEMVHFKRTNQHLDVNNITLCAGSRRPGGYVPFVNWSVSLLYVGWDFPDRCHGFLRARAAVVPSNL
jgi:hypothetical protein